MQVPIATLIYDFVSFNVGQLLLTLFISHLSACEDASNQDNLNHSPDCKHHRSIMKALIDLDTTTKKKNYPENQSCVG